MRNYETYLFDLDGTLIDSIELILSSYEHTLQHHRGESPPRDFFLRGLGIPLVEQFRAFTREPGEIDEMIDTYRAHNLRLHDQLVTAFDGAAEALRTLAERGARIAVVTNKLGVAAQRGLAVTGLEDWVEVVVAVEDVEHHKPHPEMIHQALERLGAPAQSAVTIGDSPLDLQAGAAAGTATAAALWGPFGRDTLEPHGPDHWLEHPREITGT